LEEFNLVHEFLINAAFPDRQNSGKFLLLKDIFEILLDALRRDVEMSFDHHFRFIRRVKGLVAVTEFIKSEF
jgi:hypothetical protein